MQAPLDMTNPSRTQSFVQSVDSWDRVLSPQAGFMAQADIEALDRLPGWREAVSVVDMGCGNGDYIAHVKARYPDKECFGMDYSPGLVDIAAKRHAGTGIAFTCEDIVTVEPSRTYDFVLLRLVVQHLDKDLGTFFRNLHRFCNERTRVVIIEPNGTAEEPALEPEMERMRDLWRLHGAFCMLTGKIRALVYTTTDVRLLTGRSWALERHEEVRSTFPRSSWDGLDIEGLINGWVDVIASYNSIRFDYDALRADVAKWVQTDGMELRVDFNLWSVRSLLHNDETEAKPAS